MLLLSRHTMFAACTHLARDSCFPTNLGALVDDGARPYFALWDFVYRYNFVFQQTVNTPPSADANNRRDGEDGEGASQLAQQMAAVETGEDGDPQQRNSALPEEMREAATGNSVASGETLGEF